MPAHDLYVRHLAHERGVAGRRRIRINDAVPITAHAQIESNQVGGGMGGEVATAGDVDADGFSDVLIGAPFYDTAAGSYTGLAMLAHGSPTGVGERDPTTADLAFDGGVGGDRIGASLTSAGDTNGDGYSDIIIGARSRVTGQPETLLRDGAGDRSIKRWRCRAASGGGRPRSAASTAAG